jgi:hypothetical protein
MERRHDSNRRGKWRYGSLAPFQVKVAVGGYFCQSWDLSYIFEKLLKRKYIFFKIKDFTFASIFKILKANLVRIWISL